ncbi:putative phosphotyrosyl phosphatase activator protein [Neofusicoccum parvum UCRNP2]|uniref:Serine/threonine-protein phosphatase 2A activator n=1 Tax=Botryosphaeria parva (strain UCR-NP2) TaxID=1287680 RepID=R1EI20_BOTPV|nr:putative phosphotyrosyl phosphatase activator protein [Neofusicoccum parvum UCRNP2]
MADNRQASKALSQLDPTASHEFVVPKKQINDGEDVSFFLTSTGYADIMTWLLQLNAAMFPKKNASSYQAWQLASEDVTFSEPVQRLRALMGKLEAIIDEAPPDPGPRRFGNVSFRKWYEIVESRLPKLLDDTLSPEMLCFGKPSQDNATSAKDELQAYLVGSFGSSQRLDYGTGHELSFLAFLGGIWKLGGFAQGEPGVEERGIVIGIIEPAIGFIYDVKKGPFWEHSPILFDISGGMLKMYNAEVLSKFPVVQHFPFGSLFRWEKDPTASEAPKSIHTSNQPARGPSGQASDGPQRFPAQTGTAAPRFIA